jgi:hypothetical protein
LKLRIAAPSVLRLFQSSRSAVKQVSDFTRESFNVG